VPVPHHPELTEADRAVIAERAAAAERGEPVEGYTVAPDDWDTYEQFLDCANAVLQQYLDDRAAGRAG
jgi:hypothetical protein